MLVARSFCAEAAARTRKSNCDFFARGRDGSLRLVLAGGWAEAEAFAHALPESFPVFRRHVPAALVHAHATAEIGAAGTVPSKSAEEDAAQGQKSKRLPESDLAPAE